MFKDSSFVLVLWWGWIELNYLPSGYEPPALTDELQPRFAYYSLLISVELYSYTYE